MHHDQLNVHTEPYPHVEARLYKNEEERALYHHKFETQQARLQRYQHVQLQALEVREQQAAARIAKHTEIKGTPPAAGLYEGPVISTKNALAATTAQLEFLRPTSEADIDYRLRVDSELAREIEQAAPLDLPLRFHGTHIYAARDILRAGGPSSSVDRLGISTSWDTSDQVSVTTPETVATTINAYIGVTEENCCVPIGCIFAMLPASAEEEQAGSSMLMHNVNFQEHPEQLFGVLTSHENLDNVRQWATEGGVDPEKVVEFFDFSEQLKELKQDIENGNATTQDFVPYLLDA